MISFLNNFFKLEELKTDFKTEIIAGFTTFVTMAYIIVVNPAILSAAGPPQRVDRTHKKILISFRHWRINVYFEWSKKWLQ